MWPSVVRSPLSARLGVSDRELQRDLGELVTWE